MGVLLDMDEGTISFFKDGEDFNLGRVVVVNMGVAYHNLRRNNRSPSSILYPCLGIKAGGDQLSIRSSKWMTMKGLGPGALLKHVLQAKQILLNWRDSYAYLQDENVLNKSYINQSSFSSSTTSSTALSSTSISSSTSSSTLLFQMYSAYLLWRAHDKEKVTTRPGLAVSIDTREQAVLSAGGALAVRMKMRTGMKIRTRYGDGLIIGALDTRIWFSLNNGETGE